MSEFPGLTERVWNLGRTAPYDEEDAPEFEPSEERSCSICGAWLDAERLREWNAKGDEDSVATCEEHKEEFA